ncbi:MAG: M48 family metallopeptidase [Oligoflexia bacterium]|nr:M48 family metallopeptidase [Oligoflexia bacterium]
MNNFLIVVCLIAIFSYLARCVVEWVNLRHWLASSVPLAFQDAIQEAEFKKAKAYSRDQFFLFFAEKTFFFILSISFLLIYGFGWLEYFIQTIFENPLWQFYGYLGILFFVTSILGLPFSIYSTFVVEEKYGFNRTTAKTFLLDIIKGVILSIFLGGLILYAYFWIFNQFAEWAFLIFWTFYFSLQLLLLYIAPVLIMPLFFKFSPLEDGELKRKIAELANRCGVDLAGIYTMDGSKRSSKANAFFTGFGKTKKIVLFDTLVEKFSEEEVLAVLSHEIGHYKRKHIIKTLFLSSISSLVIFYLAFWVMREPLFSASLGFQSVSAYSALIVLVLLLPSVSALFSIPSSLLSRKHEYEADSYAVEHGFGKNLGEALVKLSVDSLSNLNPHPWKVFLDYSHPPVVYRLEKIK